MDAPVTEPAPQSINQNEARQQAFKLVFDRCPPYNKTSKEVALNALKEKIPLQLRFKNLEECGIYVYPSGTFFKSKRFKNSIKF